MKRYVISILTAAVLSTITVSPALAEGHHNGHSDGRSERHDGRSWGGERDIRHFESEVR